MNMSKMVKSKVVKVPAKTGNKLKHKNEDADTDLVDGRQNLNSNQSASVYTRSRSNVTTKFSKLSNLRNKPGINYREFNKSGKPTNKINTSQSKQLDPPKQVKGKRTPKIPNHLKSVEAHLPDGNQISMNPTVGDGVIVSVHAPEDEFDDDEEDYMDQEDMLSDNSDEEQPEVVKNIPAQAGLSNEVNESDPSTESREQIMARYGNNLHFKQMFNQMLKKSVETAPTLDARVVVPGTSRDNHDEFGTPVRRNNQHSYNEPTKKRRRTSTAANPRPGRHAGMNDNTQQQAIQQKLDKTPNIKSPSDTTVYAPGLKRLNLNTPTHSEKVLDKISNFVESVRLEVAEVNDKTPPRFDVAGYDQPLAQQLNQHEPARPSPAQEVRRLSEAMVLEAE